MKFFIMIFLLIIGFISCTKTNEPHCDTWLVQAGYTFTKGVFCNHIDKPLTEYTLCFNTITDSTKYWSNPIGNFEVTSIKKDTIFYIYIVSKK